MHIILLTATEKDANMAAVNPFCLPLLESQNSEGLDLRKEVGT